jgi:TolB-like protein
VLPFANMSGDAEQEYFADGISEDIITALSKLPQLFVIARNSAFTFKGKNVNVGEVGKSLGVRHVLEGSVRKSGGRVRITAQLIDATTGGHLWAERFDRELTDIFAVQDDVTTHIVSALELNLSRAIGRASPSNAPTIRRPTTASCAGASYGGDSRPRQTARPSGCSGAQPRSTPDLFRRSHSSPRRWPTPIRTGGATSRPKPSRRPRKRRVRRSSLTSDTLTRSGRLA